MRDQCIYHLYLVRDVIPVKHEIYKWLELYDIDEGGSFNYLSISKSFQRFCEEKDGERKDLRKIKYKPKLYLKKEDLYYLWSEEAFERVENLFKAKWREIKKEKTLFLKKQVKYSKFNADRYLQELEESFEKLEIQHLTEKKMC
jgi:hypothetical protein